MKRYLLLLTSILLLTGCGAKETTVSTDRTRSVKVCQVQAEPSEESLSLSGSVVPVDQASVSFKLAGVIDKVYVKEGDRVKKGQKIASLKPVDYKLQSDGAAAQKEGAQAQTGTAQAGIAAAQAQAQAALSQVETAQAGLDAAVAQRDTAQLQIDTEIPSKIAQAKEQLNLTQTNFDNISALYNGGVATKNQMDEITAKLAVDKETYQQALDALDVANSKLKAAEAQIKAAEATKKAAENAYSGAQAQISAAQATASAAAAQAQAANVQKKAADNSLSDTVIYSPIDGVVLKKVMNDGETIAAGTPIAVVGSTEKMWIRVGVPDNYINNVQKGQKAIIHVYGTNDTIEGVVDETGALADTATRTFTVNILAENRQNILRSGMVCNTDIVFSANEKILVPVDSVISLPDRDVVYVVQGDCAKEMPVETGDIKGSKIEIKSGLTGGESLVTEGQFVLSDGDRVVTDND